MNEFSENNLVEQSAIKLFAELWGAENFANAYSGEMPARRSLGAGGDAEFGRENPGEVVPMNYLKIALTKLNPDVSTEALNLAIDEIIKDRSAMSMVNAKLKTEKFVLDWKRKEETRADVKITILDMLYDNLPEPAYSKKDCEDRSQKVYFHIYDNYVDAEANVYA